MQNLIFTTLAGLLLLLFAVSSYPFQPRNLLLLFNWVAILGVVCIAIWIFVQMNRDPLLSNLNGTKAGKISWDWDFVLRIFTYGVVPILALLGAQFPDSVGQVLSHILPERSHASVDAGTGPKIRKTSATISTDKCPYRLEFQSLSTTRSERKTGSKLFTFRVAASPRLADRI